MSHRACRDVRHSLSIRKEVMGGETWVTKWMSDWHNGFWDTRASKNYAYGKPAQGSDFHFEFFCSFPQNAHTLHTLEGSIFIRFLCCLLRSSDLDLVTTLSQGWIYYINGVNLSQMPIFNCKNSSLKPKTVSTYSPLPIGAPWTVKHQSSLSVAQLWIA